MAHNRERGAGRTGGKSKILSLGDLAEGRVVERWMRTSEQWTLVAPATVWCLPKLMQADRSCNQCGISFTMTRYFKYHMIKVLDLSLRGS